MGREEEGRYILGRLRGEHDGVAEAEFQDIVNVVKLERESTFVNSYWKMFFGIGSGKLHIGRRVQLVIWLQILQEWIDKYSCHTELSTAADFFLLLYASRA